MVEETRARPKSDRAEATKSRLLAAAADEFTDHGMAGARVDRIAERAGANKRLIYIYFGSKEQLFDAVVARDIEAMIDAVPFNPDDLPGYAVALFDYLTAHPQLHRLFQWRNLERPEVSAVEQRSYTAKVAALTDAQRAGRLASTFSAADILTLGLGLITSWATASGALQTLAEHSEDPERCREQRRTTLRHAVAALLRPPAAEDT